MALGDTNMSNSVLIIGGSGKVARRVTSLLASQSPPYTIHSIVRSESQISSLKVLGASPIIHSIEGTSPSSLASVMRSLQPPPSAIVWSAGAGGSDPSRTETVDHQGAIKAMDAAAEAGIKRFIVVSALDMRDRENKPVPSWYNDDDEQRSDRLWGAIGAYMRAKLAADIELVTGNEKRGLKYTIVRPGQLTDDEGVGKVSAGKIHLGSPISRADVAGTIFQCLKNDATIGLAFDVMGGDEDITEAVERVARDREDCFEGYY